MVLLTDGETEPVRPDALLTAMIDPLAELEATLLSHLYAAHPEVTDQLTRLLAPRLLLGVVRVVPLSLDSYGLVLRLEYSRSHRDVRLAFTSPSDSAFEVRQRVAALLAYAGSRRTRRRRAPATPPPL